MALSALEALDQLRIAIADNATETPEPGFKTVREWANESGQSLANAGRILRDAASRNLIEKRTYRVRAGEVVRPTAHYRAIPVSRNKKTK